MIFYHLHQQKIRPYIICLNCNFLCCIALLTLSFPINGYAELRGSLTGTTDYFWRGYSRSDGKPAAQANIDYEFKSGIYLGSFGSTVNFGDHGFENRSTLEFRPYLGYAYKLSEDWRFNIEATRYIYNGKIFGQDVDYNEFYFYSHFRDLVTAIAYFSDNSYQQKHIAYGFEVTGRYPITQSIEFSSTLGYNNQKQVLQYNYLYWTSGLTVHLARNIGVDVRYYDGVHTATANKHDEQYQSWGFHPHVVDNRVLFSITVGF